MRTRYESGLVYKALLEVQEALLDIAPEEMDIDLMPSPITICTCGEIHEEHHEVTKEIGLLINAIDDNKD
jgi:hypothetical protein